MDNNKEINSKKFMISIWTYVLTILIILMFAVVIIYFEKNECNKYIKQYIGEIMMRNNTERNITGFVVGTYDWNV